MPRVNAYGSRAPSTKSYLPQSPPAHTQSPPPTPSPPPSSYYNSVPLSPSNPPPTKRRRSTKVPKVYGSMMRGPASIITDSDLSSMSPPSHSFTAPPTNMSKPSTNALLAAGNASSEADQIAFLSHSVPALLEYAIPNWASLTKALCTGQVFDVLTARLNDRASTQADKEEALAGFTQCVAVGGFAAVKRIGEGGHLRCLSRMLSFPAATVKQEPTEEDVEMTDAPPAAPAAPASTAPAAPPAAPSDPTKGRRRKHGKSKAKPNPSRVSTTPSSAAPPLTFTAKTLAELELSEPTSLPLYLLLQMFVTPPPADNSAFSFYDSFIASLAPLLPQVVPFLHRNKSDQETLAVGCELLDAMLCLGLERPGICSSKEQWLEFATLLIAGGQLKLLVSLTHENAPLVDALLHMPPTSPSLLADLHAKFLMTSDTDSRLYISNTIANVYDCKPDTPAPPATYVEQYRSMSTTTERELVVLRSNVAVSLALSPFVAACDDARMLALVRDDVDAFLEVMQRTTGMVEMGMFSNVQKARQECDEKVVALAN